MARLREVLNAIFSAPDLENPESPNISKEFSCVINIVFTY
ncbi:hypothetical protein EC2875000_0275 [Escherichia coli 2875000]|nr:hypothetical protein EC2875000_0275 [Escherichia coli 2875000]EMV79779.1 hypothetical protein EC2866450_0274 [Escherichia coli 2866450]EMV80846.1 hypothetical protein EC2866750_0282 [Escherichia coli 2866750]EMW09505.1 hypothetical protein EC2853500_0290 [Escherichia coli 2853500]EMW65478.1 hypothetical protein EC2756500_0274 [Escherichia coli 2756500]EMX20564.1 hypothetical protein EC174750_5369 [Escherichia coli 174750]